MFEPIRFSGVLVGSCVLLASAGCSQLGPSCNTSDEANPAVPYKEGTVHNGAYMSSSWYGKLLVFEGGKRYYVHHKLGCTPRSVVMYESFNESGLGAGTMAPCAGNMCELQRIDQTGIMVKNDTCSDFYLLVIASSPDCSLNLDAGDDGADLSEASEGGAEANAD